jgi:hypothetical protein
VVLAAGSAPPYHLPQKWLTTCHSEQSEESPHQIYSYQ